METKDLKDHLKTLSAVYQELRSERLKGNKNVNRSLGCLEQIIQLTIMFNKLEAKRKKAELVKTNDK